MSTAVARVLVMLCVVEEINSRTRESCHYTSTLCEYNYAAAVVHVIQQRYSRIKRAFSLFRIVSTVQVIQTVQAGPVVGIHLSFPIYHAAVRFPVQRYTAEKPAYGGRFGDNCR